MYHYTHDPETGGLLLTSLPGAYSKEPRPVYAAELDLLGFNAFYNYASQDDVPYMWAEANYYWYRGQKIARIKGGGFAKKPELTLERDDAGAPTLAPETTLKPVDLEWMREKNALVLTVLRHSAQKRIVRYYEKYKDKIDCFYVAFSGGKDSIVLLDLVKRALPERSFVVLFGDTGMEFPDTYELLEQVEQECAATNLQFYRAKSRLDPEESWRLFGPPAKTLRWCCSVHKSAPQTLKLREITQKQNCAGFAFVGVREHESVARSRYAVFNYGKKQKGQYALHPLLEWSSAEIWLYIYSRGLPINAAYKKGNSRVGCVCCPMSVEGSSAWFRRVNYQSGYDNYLKIVRESLSEEINKDIYIKDCVWTQRYSGRDLQIQFNKHSDEQTDNIRRLRIDKDGHFWKEWRKTLPVFPFSYTERETESSIEIDIPKEFASSPLATLLKTVALKSVYCVGCGTCEANCPHEALKFNGSRPSISGCKQCGVCHSIDSGCLLIRSIRKPEVEKMVNGDKKKSINVLESYNINDSWFNELFNKDNDFWKSTKLGPNQKKVFKRLLSYAGFYDKKNKLTPFYSKFKSIGVKSQTAWQLFLINSANLNPENKKFNSQFKWYIKSIPIGLTTTQSELEYKLENESVTGRAGDIINALEKLSHMEIGNALNLNIVVTQTGKDKSITVLREKPVPPDPRVILYGLYKFAEACGGYYEIPLGRLVDFEIESDGVSPAEIFALSRDETGQYLRGLAQNYPDFVLNFTSTHGLEILNLNPGKKAEDVLELFA